MSARGLDIAQLAGRARRAALDAGDDAIVVATIAWPERPDLEPLACADESAGDAMAWHPPQGPRFAGRGHAARIDAAGADRVSKVRAAAEALFSRIVDVRDPDDDGAPSPRLFGGIAFRAEASRGDPWRSFGDASFTLPRVRLAITPDGAWLSVALRAEAARAEGAVERAFDDAWSELAGVAAAPSAQPRALRLERASAETFGRAVRSALRRIDEGAFEKVVPMAPCRVIADHPLSPARALGRLASAYPTCTRFAFQRGDSVFLGASPETLIALASGVARADALAGTSRRVEGEAADARARSALLMSDKDLREHRAVVDAVVAALEPYARALRSPGAPRLKSLRNVHHLHTPIEADVLDATHVLDLVARLHPTPAVAGAPRDRALAWLAENELESRGWYAGPVGWFDARGEGAFAVALRAGVIAGPRAWLYAGAGIVAGSDAAAEYAETRAKHAPMLEALEVGP